MSDEKVLLKDVQCDFIAALWTKQGFVDPNTGVESKPKNSLTIILDKEQDKEQIAGLKAHIKSVANSYWNGKIPGAVKYALRDGSEKDHLGGYDDTKVFFQAHNKRSVPVVDKNNQPTSEADGLIYAGCRVDVTVSAWAQDNKWGKRVNLNLRAVRFSADDEPLSGGGASPDSEFGPPEDDSDPMLGM